MVLTLSVENVDRLPDGGPLSIRVERHGFDIGRNAYLDWTLPDDSRHISGRHCEVRYENGRYLLYDISTNGTFVNGSENRVQSPYELRDGDELEIGRYIISVRIEGAGAGAGAARAPSTARDDMQASFAPDPPQQDVWAVENDPLAPPIPADDLRPKAHKKPVQPDFLEWVVDPLSPAAVRPPAGSGTGSPSGSATSEPPGAAFGWANDPPPPPPPDVWTVEPPPPPAGRDDPWSPAARPPAASGEDAWRVEPSPPPPSRPAAPAAPTAPTAPRPPAKGAPAEKPAGGGAADAGGSFAEWRDAPESGKPFDPATGAPGLGERAERQVAASELPDAAGEPSAAWPSDAGGGPPPVGPGADEPRQRTAPTASESPPMPTETAAGTAMGDHAAAMEKLIDGLAEATGLSPEAFAALPPDELGRMLGRFMLLTLENLKDLLDARASAKTLARSTRRTMVQAVDNNPVKFLPTAADALKVVLNDRINGYLPYDRALTESFNDIKQHQVETYAAMRYALSRLVEEISPETIERETPSSGGLMQNKDARQWRTFLTKWKAMAAGQDGGMNERFMMHFAEFYDRER